MSLTPLRSAASRIACASPTSVVTGFSIRTCFPASIMRSRIFVGIVGGRDGGGDDVARGQLLDVGGVLAADLVGQRFRSVRVQIADADQIDDRVGGERHGMVLAPDPGADHRHPDPLHACLPSVAAQSRASLAGSNRCTRAAAQSRLTRSPTAGAWSGSATALTARPPRSHMSLPFSRPTSTSKIFIAGLPMNAATNRFAGWR